MTFPCSKGRISDPRTKKSTTRKSLNPNSKRHRGTTRGTESREARHAPFSSTSRESIVEDPDAVFIDSVPARSGLRFELHVAPGDMGRIIGKRGRVAQALHALVRAAAAKDGTDASIDIVD